MPAMGDDPDDLAAAFFAQQAAKEKAKATLPTEDWVRVLEATKIKGPRAAAGNNEGAERIQSTGASSDGGDVTDSKSWLVTTMPPAPEYHAAAGKEGGIVGIILDRSNLGYNLGGGASMSDADANEGKELSAAEEEARRRMKEQLVRQLEEKMTR